MKKKICVCLLSVVVICILFGCGKDTAVTLEVITPETVSAKTTNAAAEESAICGIWKVDGVFSKGRLYSVHLDEALEDLYKNTSLTFYEDGTFLYHNMFITEGTYSQLEEKNETAFLLQEGRTYRLSFQDGQVMEIDATDSGRGQMFVSLQDDGLLRFGKFDPVTGDIKASETPLYFSRDGEPIVPVESGKPAQTPAPATGTRDKASAEDSKAANSYEKILNEYTKKMKDAAPGLVREFKREASGVSDIMTLAELSNDKVGELAEICNNGVGEMASLMYKKGDTYSTYESWAMKLQENYTEIAEEIQNAYLDAAMNCF